MEHTLSYLRSFVLNMERIHRELHFFSRSRSKNVKNLSKFKCPDPEKNVTRNTPSNDSDHLLSTVIIWSFMFNIKIIHPELWTLQSGHDDFLSQGRMTLKIYVKVKGHHMRQTPLMLLIICTKFGKNPSWIVDVTGRTRKVNGQTDRQTDRVNPISPPNLVAGGITIIYILFCMSLYTEISGMAQRYFNKFRTCKIMIDRQNCNFANNDIID